MCAFFSKPVLMVNYDRTQYQNLIDLGLGVYGWFFRIMSTPRNRLQVSESQQKAGIAGCAVGPENVFVGVKLGMLAYKRRYPYKFDERQLVSLYVAKFFQPLVSANFWNLAR